MAPAARLVIQDLEGTAGTGALGTPSNLNTNYFIHSYNAGARIHSDSWGSDSTSYTRQAQAVDEFAYEHPDFLSLFAAGNDGQDSVSRR